MTSGASEVHAPSPPPEYRVQKSSKLPSGIGIGRPQRTYAGYAETPAEQGGVAEPEVVEVEAESGAQDSKKFRPSYHFAAAKLSPLEQYIRAFLEFHGIKVLWDGRLQFPDELLAPKNREEVPVFLRRPHRDEAWFLDQVHRGAIDADLKVSKVQLQLAWLHVREDCVRARTCEVLNPLYDKLTPEEEQLAEELWQRLAACCFDVDGALVVAVLKQFIFQTKAKAVNLGIARPLMPIIFNEVQGSGKSYFVSRLLEPLQELASPPVPLSTIADTRSVDIYKYCVLYVDDADGITRGQAPNLKQLMSNTHIARRRLGTNGYVVQRQCSTFIGTSNWTVDDLIPDETGHRRFVSLEFRNGEIAKGGDPNVWKVVRELDIPLLWKSVNVLGDEPIEPVLQQLTVKQGDRVDPFSSYRDWIFSLDVNDADVARLIKQRPRQSIQASHLYDLYRRLTEKTDTDQALGRMMQRIVNLPGSPFDPPFPTPKGRFFPLKQTFTEKAKVQ